VNIGVEPYLVNATLIAAVAQRLIRVLCPYCKKSYRPSPYEMEKITGVMKVLGRKETEEVILYNKVGCKFCNGIGYKGRTALFEIMVMSPRIREMALSGTSHMEIKSQAMREGMRTLYENGVRKALEGITTLEEVLRVVPPEERALELIPERVPERKVPGLAEAPRKLAPLIS